MFHIETNHFYIADTVALKNFSLHLLSKKQRLSTSPGHRSEYLFVDTVRFWSMLAIVALHAIGTVQETAAEGIFPSAAACFFKYGTIGFFLISGFLLGDRMDLSAPLQYLSRRLKTLLMPWAFWFALYVLYLLAGDASHHRLLYLSISSWRRMVPYDLRIAAFGSAFWFIPNLVVGMCILVKFRLHLHRLSLGAALFAINIVYVFNIYGEWFTPRHTSALFGFISFLWLGSFAAKNFSRVSRFIDRVPTMAFAALTATAYVLCVAETHLLTLRHSADPLNTLRPSNQLFSVLVVLLLLKLKKASWPSFINVRKQTFCIYLTHSFFLRLGYSALYRNFVPAGAYPSVRLAFLLRGLLFVFAYGGSLLMARWISGRDGWQWTVGLPTTRDPEEVPTKNGQGKNLGFRVATAPFWK